MTRKQSDQLLFDEKLRPYYHINGKEYLCKKCNENIGTKRLQHYESCIGIGVVRQVRNTPKEEIRQLISNEKQNCDLGCGNKATYFHKNGRAYCCNLGNACPIKKENDRNKKKGINPFEGKIHPKGALGKDPWNKGFTKDTHTSVLNGALSLIKTYALHGDPRKNFKHSPQSKAKLSAAAFRRGIGGYKIGAGKGKRGWYKGFFCDSSWELAYVIYCLEHNIDIKRNTEKRPYIWNNKKKNYIPDFIVEGDLVELKGYPSPEWFAKLKYNPDVKPLYQNDLKEVFKYVKDKYGKDYIKLYEKPKTGSKF